MSKSELIALGEFARRRAITLRQAQRLRAAGLPMQADKVLWPAGSIWYDDRIAKRSAKPEDLEAAKARKMDAEAALAELDLQERRGTLVHVDDVGKEVGRVLDNLRARILAAPGKYAPRFGPLPIAQAQARLEDLSRELIAELAETKDLIPLEESAA